MRGKETGRPRQPIKAVNEDPSQRRKGSRNAAYQDLGSGNKGISFRSEKDRYFGIGCLLFGCVAKASGRPSY
ncbi:hypothetical protein OE88DRAFT_1660812 [Heliocybe sulcata]|uniref:Uncharacterized protein n=1 Tax=Heliocybe sulcata TaxID=5364 RepID=A0A5C3MZG1_9AGAM|nr:hypothetical protein OE88DRAFT_1660812 [Heliocybe sulcata]